MKTEVLTLFSLLALLLVSTAVLADGRPTGIRIGRVANVGAIGVEMDITIPGTDSLYIHPEALASLGPATLSVGNVLGASYAGFEVWQYASTELYEPLPWAIEWGDGDYVDNFQLFGPPGGPWVGTFTHSYPPSGSPQTYTITVGDALCCSPVYIPPPGKGMAKGLGVTTGNVITGTYRYLSTWGNSATFTSTASARLVVTNTAAVTTSTAIPTLNVYGLLAMAFVLVGAGVLLVRKPRQA